MLRDDSSSDVSEMGLGDGDDACGQPCVEAAGAVEVGLPTP